MAELTQKRLKELLRYCPETGVFVWLKSTGRAGIGSIAGNTHVIDGYTQVGIDGTVYRAHRLAFLYMTGVFPVAVDHINGVRSDNRYLNLREADAMINAQNTRISAQNKTGLPGVTFFAMRKRSNHIYFVAYITANNVRSSLYEGRDLFEACCRRKSAENKHGFHINHGRSA